MAQVTKYHGWVKPAPSWVELVGFRRGKAAKNRKSRREGGGEGLKAPTSRPSFAPREDWEEVGGLPGGPGDLLG